MYKFHKKNTIFPQQCAAFGRNMNLSPHNRIGLRKHCTDDDGDKYEVWVDSFQVK